MSIAVCTLTVLAGLLALLTNRDMFSPGKFYLISFVMFYVGALATPGDYELWSLILLVLLIGIATVCFEARSSASVKIALPAATHARERNLPLLIWLASLPAIGAQVYLVQYLGGFEGYVNAIGNRVIETRGLGWAKTLSATIVLLDLLYFAIGLTRRRSWLWWSGFIVHLGVLLGIGALSGSRGSILTVFPMQLFLYHYLRRPVKILYAMPMGAVLIALAIVIGIARQSLRLDQGALSGGVDTTDQLLSVSIFNYGVQPLQILLRTGDLQLAHGSTLLSVLTNPVPRVWWPDKPDTGGVYFTNLYTGNAWDSASYLTPTFLGEGVINFGWVGGMAFFLAADLVLMYLLVRFYRRTLAKLRERIDAGVAIDLVVYLLVMWGVVALMVGEVTNTVQELALTQILPALALKAVLVRRGPRLQSVPA
jgi:hypothetical protein